jgi:tRNA pseudouridine38-40 synthase
VTRRVRIDLAYDGTDYVGWQIQPGLRTVQGELEAALARVEGGGRVVVRGAGRTDAGVHARGQVADADTGARLDDAGLHRALLAIPPADVRVQRVLTVDAAFDARRDAVSKTYAYVLDRTRSADPFVSRYALHVPRPLDDAAIDAALELLPGTRDWTGYTAASCEVGNRLRTLSVARRDRIRPGIESLVFTADGFLTHMVRNLVGTILAIGRGRFRPEHALAVIEAKDRALAGPTAPPHALALEVVRYR